MSNDVVMQYFEWYLPDDGQHWQRLAGDVQHLKEIGISMVWLPPAFKGTSSSDVGYGVYDLFDLGEFDQKGTIRTKYGSKEDYLNAIETLKANGISPIADVVLNHKASADSTESFTVVEVDPNDRTKILSEPFTIQGWTHFTFDGRHDIYNDFHWHWYHFTGTDFDAASSRQGIFQIQGDNKGWADSQLVDQENGNYDYLMYADLDFKHPEVIKNIDDWVEWFLDTTGIEGFRLDAVKHIDSYFMKNFIYNVKKKMGDDFYVFGEFWNGDQESNKEYLANIDYSFDLVDVKLHQNLFDASQVASAYDLRQVFEGTLVQNNPESAVTFVDNHDTQRGQALESTVAEWFKPAAYSIILLRQQGLPCVFYGDYYGISGEFAQQDFQDELDKLLYVRQYHVYGEQIDYLDAPDCIGWVNLGSEEHPDGSVVLISNDQATSKRMDLGVSNAGKTFVDIMGVSPEEVQIGEDGWAEFPVQGQSVSVWINNQTLESA